MLGSLGPKGSDALHHQFTVGLNKSPGFLSSPSGYKELRLGWGDEAEHREAVLLGNVGL